jgi:predicted short-subunit dehydrogenase-like oxidoreductase (DUF2520 family)
MGYFAISIIGAGNVGSFLAKAFEESGHTVNEIYSRNYKNASKLCSQLYSTEPTDSLDFSESKSTIFILAVSDSAIADVASEIVLPDNAIIAHTSGAAPMELLENTAGHYGVFYPLQTFTKGRRIDYKEIPFCIEGESKQVTNILIKLASTLSKYVHQLNSDQRKILHLAAVFACNFNNHLLTISKGLLDTEKVSFEILKPLVNETVRKAFDLGPENSQTGPAIRKDEETISAHLEILKLEERLSQLYSLFTEDIASYHLNPDN